MLRQALSNIPAKNTDLVMLDGIVKRQIKCSTVWFFSEVNCIPKLSSAKLKCKCENQRINRFYMS